MHKTKVQREKSNMIDEIVDHKLKMMNEMELYEFAKYLMYEDLAKLSYAELVDEYSEQFK